jgi:hypothetical protein
MNELQIWLPIALAALAIVVTIVVFVLNRRKGRRDQYRELLDKFLRPLESYLKRNKTAFEALLKDHKIEVNRLEFFPSQLKSYFQQLPETDLRKRFWVTDIERIHSVNQDAVKLIKTYEGNTLLRRQFREVCSDFVKHADDWKARWDDALGSSPVIASIDEREIASTFPESMERELQAELERVSALARIRPAP